VNDSATKRCGKCGEVKPLDDFSRSAESSDGHQRWCRGCHREYRLANRDRLLEMMRQRHQANREADAEAMRQWRDLHPEKVRENNRRWYAANRERSLRNRRDAANKQRRQVFAHYGECCVCCGSTENLTIDHLDGRGGEHRKELYGRQAAGERFYRWLIRNSFPDGYQTLCHPCNISKGDGERCRMRHR
jgi:hypothetical protein